MGSAGIWWFELILSDLVYWWGLVVAHLFILGFAIMGCRRRHRRRGFRRSCRRWRRRVLVGGWCGEVGVCVLILTKPWFANQGSFSLILWLLQQPVQQQQCSPPFCCRFSLSIIPLCKSTFLSFSLCWFLFSFIFFFIWVCLKADRMKPGNFSFVFHKMFSLLSSYSFLLKGNAYSCICRRWWDLHCEIC